MLVGIQSAYDDDVKDLEFETGGRGGDSRVVVQIFCRYGREGSLCVVTRMNNQPLHIFTRDKEIRFTINTSRIRSKEAMTLLHPSVLSIIRLHGYPTTLALDKHQSKWQG